MLKRTALVFTLVVGVVALALAQGPRRDGQWEIKIEMNMPGMPAGAMPPMTTTQCVTPAEAADPQKAIPSQGRGRGNPDCKVTDYKVDGNKVSWAMKCEGAQAMSGRSEFVYTKDAYTGTMTMDMQGQGAMTMKYTGKRLGDCTK